MKLSREEVLHIAALARVGVDEADVEELSEKLSNILENFRALEHVDTNDIPPTAQSIALKSVMREDEVAPSLPAADVLANAPLREGEFFKIKAVLED